MRSIPEFIRVVHPLFLLDGDEKTTKAAIIEASKYIKKNKFKPSFSSFFGNVMSANDETAKMTKEVFDSVDPNRKERGWCNVNMYTYGTHVTHISKKGWLHYLVTIYILHFVYIFKSIPRRLSCLMQRKKYIRGFY